MGYLIWEYHIKAYLNNSKFQIYQNFDMWGKKKKTITIIQMILNNKRYNTQNIDFFFNLTKSIYD